MESEAKINDFLRQNEAKYNWVGENSSEPLPFCLQTSELRRPLGGQPVQFPAFTAGETEAKKGERVCARSHSKEREKKE